MADTFTQICGRVQLRVPMASRFLVEDWVRNAWRETVRFKRWSWRVKYGQFLFPAVYNTGTVTVTQSSATVTGVGTAFTASMVGLQFRIGSPNPIYTIDTVVSPTQLTLTNVWGPSTAATQGFQIYKAYVTVPADFHAFVSVYDTRYNFQLWTDWTQGQLNLVDAQRSNSGNAYLLAFLDYSSPLGLPRLEVWPHLQSEYVLPYQYEMLMGDISDTGFSLPRSIDGNMLLEYALGQAAMWPGPSADKPNPFYRLELADRHTKAFNTELMRADKNDEELWQQDVQYQEYSSWSWAPIPIFGDADFLQKHDF